MQKKQRAITDKEKNVKRESILNAARKLFFTHGYHGTTIEMITEQCKVSTGTFYLYFKNKVEIYKTLQKEGLDRLYEMIENSLSWPGMSSLSKLTEIAKTYFQFYTHYREYFDIIAVLSASPDELKEKQTDIAQDIDKKTTMLMKNIEGIIKEGVSKGEFKSIDTWKVTNIFWAMMDGLILLEERNNLLNVVGINLEAMIKEALKMTFYGIVANNDTTIRNEKD